MTRLNRCFRVFLLGLFVAVLLPVGGVCAGVPGSATMPPRTVKDPNPPPPTGGRRTSVELGVWIRADGTVEDAEVLRGDREWGVQAMETVKQWVFQPVEWEGKPIAARTEVSFSSSSGGVVSSISPVPNLPGERHFEKEFGLEPPVLDARPALAYLRGLLASGVSGNAKVEFVIDRSGLAQLPRVVEASAPEFGWAAATWVNGMRFAPVSRSGQAAELRVLLPVQFTPPVELGVVVPAG